MSTDCVFLWVLAVPLLWLVYLPSVVGIMGGGGLRAVSFMCWPVWGC